MVGNAVSAVKKRYNTEFYVLDRGPHLLDMRGNPVVLKGSQSAKEYWIGVNKKDRGFIKDSGELAIHLKDHKMVAFIHSRFLETFIEQNQFHKDSNGRVLLKGKVKEGRVYLNMRNGPAYLCSEVETIDTH